jgi:arsenate reductase (glutaredoxin)
MITIYGIKNCQTVQKAVKYLESNNIPFEFWDYKKQGIDSQHLNKWCAKFGWEKVLNRSGMMWRKANEETKAKVTDQQSAIDFMMTTPTSIKRPIIDTDIDLLIGYDEAEYKAKLKS